MWEGLTLADPNFHQIGAQAHIDRLTNRLSLTKDKPTTLNTIFSWIFMDDIPMELPSLKMNSIFVLSTNTDQLLEKCGKWKRSIHMIKHVKIKSTITRGTTAHYVACLSFKNGTSANLGSNREIALSKYLQQKQFQRKPEVQNQYRPNYKTTSNGHMSLAPEPSQYILTDHGDVQESSSSYCF